MNLVSFKKLVTMLTAVLTLSVVPTSASAGGSVHINVPGFSIGYHGDYYGRKHYRKNYNRAKRSHRYYRNQYRDRDYYNYRPRRSYNYYYDGYRSRDRYRSRYRNDYDYCPTPGFSVRYYRNRGCYSHGDHYHCDD